MQKMNDGTIEIDGKFYRHDYDFDCYYRVQEPTSETFREKVIKIIVALVLLAIIVIGSKYYF